MSPKLRFLISAACLSPVVAFADATLYGRANVTLSAVDEGPKSSVLLDSNASRIGIKGSEKLPPAGRWEMIYQAEYEAAFDDGQTGSSNTGGPFSQRNIYVGVKGPMGQMIAGNFDTPLKTVQKKVDLFDNLKGDISTILTNNEKRMSNSVQYTSPKVAGFTGYLDYIASEQAEEPGKPKIDDAFSLAGTYEIGTFYAALAFDHNVRALPTTDYSIDATRLVLQYTVDDFQFGLLLDHDSLAKTPTRVAVSTNGVMGSVQYTLNKKWVFKGQLGQSDNVKKDATAYSLGVDYIFSKNSRVFGFWSSAQADALAADIKEGALVKFPKQTEVDNTYLGVGAEMSF